jgi:hypothetical protein
MNICCSGVKIILIDNILRTKLLRQLMTFLTVQLLFDKLRHTVLMLLFCRTYLTRNFFQHTVLSLCLTNYLANERLNEWEIIRPTKVMFFFLMEPIQFDFIFGFYDKL